MPRVNRYALIVLGVIALFLVTFAGSCDDNGNRAAQDNESAIQQDNYSRLAAATPAHTMKVSPTRNTINGWIDTWGSDPNKLSYVYFQAATGALTGYYIFKGLPVNYCVSLTPNYRWEDAPDDGGDQKFQVPAPSIDGVYYSGGGCQTFYGFDAVSGAYMEYTVGSGINVLLYDQPLPRQDVQPLGVATVDAVKK